MVGRCIPYWNGHFLGDMLVFRGVPSVRITFASEVLPNFQFKTNVAKMDIVGDKLEGPKMPKAVQLVDANLRSKQWICRDCCMKLSPVAMKTMKHEIDVLYTTIYSNIWRKKLAACPILLWLRFEVEKVLALFYLQGLRWGLHRLCFVWLLTFVIVLLLCLRFRLFKLSQHLWFYYDTWWHVMICQYCWNVSQQYCSQSSQQSYLRSSASRDAHDRYYKLSVHPTEGGDTREAGSMANR